MEPSFLLIHMVDSTFHRRLAQTGLSILLKSKISSFYGLTANDDKTLSSFPLSLQNGKRVSFFLLTSFSMFAFCKREHSASRLKSQFSSLKSVFFPRHSLTQFSNLSFLIHSPTSLLLPLPCLFCFPAVNAIMKYNEKNVALFIELCTVLYFGIEVFL